MGLPRRRDEYWRFTDPSDFVAVTSDPVEAQADGDMAFEGADALRLVFVDGRFDVSASDALEGTGLEVDRLAVAAERDIHWAQALFGTLETAGHDPVARPLAALNTAFAEDGVILRAAGIVERPVHIVHRHVDATADVMLHHLVRVESGASLTLLESGAAAARLNTVMEVDLGDGATFRHVRSQPLGQDRRTATHVFARLGTRSDFRTFTLTLDGALTRNDVVVMLGGEDGVAHIAGASVGEGDGFHHDDTIFITHDALRCESRQVFKKVLREGAVGVFQGKILVRKGAQKTDGYQLCQALLLDEGSQLLAKPELEIYADDVVCSHGATVGAIDEGALFYLRSRGVPEAESRDLLTMSFLRQALDEITDEALASDLSERLESWLARRR